MTHTVINGAGMSVGTDAETLPELADAIVDDMRIRSRECAYGSPSWSRY
jgi:hypothetical protein